MELISAIATASGRGGVAIVRVSGDGALGLAKAMFSRKGDFEPNKMYAGEIDGGAFRDFGMCVYFRAPHSFTGEDVVEFHCHGGTELARGILQKTFDLGARPAERGEFTKRAFLNGKLSLSAAEGMADMINAESSAQVRAGYLLYGEALTREARRLQTLLTTALASVDADVDYPEEGLNASSRAEILPLLREAENSLSALLSQYRTGKKIKSGVTVVLCGKPNAGKSTLFNALLGYDRAIVSPVAGTTRDTVEGVLELNGVLFRLVDTAGLRVGESEIEEEGVRRAEQALKSADLILWLKEEGEELSFPEGTPVITVGAKSDIKMQHGVEICVSAKTGEGLETLKNLLLERGMGEAEEGAFLMEERHYAAVREAKEGVSRAIEAVEGNLPPELYAQDMKGAWDALGLVTGETATETLIDEIFSKFCVGK